MIDWLVENIGAPLIVAALVAIAGLVGVGIGLRHRIVNLWDRRPWPPINRVPRSAGETRRLLAARPRGWEHLHLAGELLRGLAAQERRYLDHEARVARPSGLVLSDEDFGDRLSAEFHSIILALQNWERLMNGPSYEAAIGRPGEPGDPARIEHLADGLTEAYVRTMDWSDRLRGARAPAHYRRAVEILSRFPGQPIEQYRAFVADVVGRTDGIPALLRDTRREGQSEMTFELVLSTADDVRAEWDTEYARLTS